MSGLESGLRAQKFDSESKRSRAVCYIRATCHGITSFSWSFLIIFESSHRMHCAAYEAALRWAIVLRALSEQLRQRKWSTLGIRKRINRGGAKPPTRITPGPRNHRQRIVSTHVWIHKLRRRRSRRHRYPHRSATPKGQGYRNRQGGRRPYPPGKVSIQYVILSSMH